MASDSERMMQALEGKSSRNSHSHLIGEQHYYPYTEMDESLRNFHWCLIRNLHNYPFSLTDYITYDR